MAVLHGNLAPQRRGHQALRCLGAKLLRHTGRAVVFDSPSKTWPTRIDLPTSTSPRTTSSSCATPVPRARPACPKRAICPSRIKLARQGVKDMVRISDARMSGTAFGTIVLHIAPESAVGGPLAIVQTGDRIAARRRSAAASTSSSTRPNCKRRLAAWKRLPPHRESPTRGYARLFDRHCPPSRRGLRLRLPPAQWPHKARPMRHPKHPAASDTLIQPEDRALQADVNCNHC
jgi:dihydroxy-acid dehydratase